jgi:hypothetical protein
MEDIKCSLKTGIGPTTDRMVNGIISACTTPEVKNMLTDAVINPITDIVNQKMRPYVNICVALYFAIIVLLCINIYMIYRK